MASDPKPPRPSVGACFFLRKKRVASRKRACHSETGRGLRPTQHYTLRFTGQLGVIGLRSFSERPGDPTQHYTLRFSRPRKRRSIQKKKNLRKKKSEEDSDPQVAVKNGPVFGVRKNCTSIGKFHQTRSVTDQFTAMTTS